MLNEYRCTRPALFVSGSQGNAVLEAYRVGYYVRASTPELAIAHMAAKYQGESFTAALERENVQPFSFTIENKTAYYAEKLAG